MHSISPHFRYWLRPSLIKGACHSLACICNTCNTASNQVTRRVNSRWRGAGRPAALALCGSSAVPGRRAASRHCGRHYVTSSSHSDGPAGSSIDGWQPWANGGTGMTVQACGGAVYSLRPSGNVIALISPAVGPVTTVRHLFAPEGRTSAPQRRSAARWRAERQCWRCCSAWRW